MKLCGGNNTQDMAILVRVVENLIRQVKRTSDNLVGREVAILPERDIPRYACKQMRPPYKDRFKTKGKEDTQSAKAPETYVLGTSLMTLDVSDGSRNTTYS